MTAPAGASWPAGTAWDDGIDWAACTEEALDRLRAYIRFPTVNDPGAATADAPWRAGYEAEATEWLATILRREGIDCDVHTAAPGRTTLVARLRAERPAAAPITLLSHSDVVPVDKAEWDLPPFDATVRGGLLYGRGVLDLKGLGIAQLTTLLLLRQQRVPLRRDVVVIVAADEETGGEYGVRSLLRERPELLNASVLLGEGGYSPTGVLPGGRALHAVAVAEKGYLELELTTEGAAHHASMPAPDSAPARLVRALERVLRLAPVVRVTAPTERLCQSLAEGASGLHRVLLRRPRLLAMLGTRHLPAGSLVSSMLTETCAVTILQSGYKSNVVPGEARAVLSMRLLPGTTAEQATERVQKALADAEVRVRRVMYKPPSSSQFDIEDFKVLTRLAAAEGAVASPILSPGASDARYWRAAGVPAYGWVPFTLPVGDIHGVHGPNERLSLQAFSTGVRHYYRTVAELATAPGAEDAHQRKS